MQQLIFMKMKIFIVQALQCAVECLFQNEKDDEDRNNYFFFEMIKNFCESIFEDLPKPLDQIKEDARPRVSVLKHVDSIKALRNYYAFISSRRFNSI